MAVEAVFGGDIVWHSEVDPAASKVLAHHYPDVPNLGDITRIGWEEIPPVDILCGGFPCTDVSAAGKRAGLHGTRSGLWSYYANAIDILRPRMVIIENVRGLLSAHAHRPMESDDTAVGNLGVQPVLRAAGAVLGDLADLGYDAWWATVSAASVGAPHRRERVFVIAHADEGGWGGRREASRGDVGGHHEVDRGWRGESASGRGGPTGGDPLAGFDPDMVSDDDYDDPDPTWTSSEDIRARLAADTSRYGRDEGRPEPARLIRGPDAPVGGDGPVNLLPTPVVTDACGTRNSTAWRSDPNSTANIGDTLTDAVWKLAADNGDMVLPNGPTQQRFKDDLLPMPNASDASGGGQHPDKRTGHTRQLIDYALLCTPSAADGAGGHLNRSGDRKAEQLLPGQAREMSTAWGKYELAIRRWESLTRPAPAPTEPNKNGNPRLSAAFSEWLMGWPAGWVTDPAIGISRNDQLRIVGNGVVPQQAIAALTYLLQFTPQQIGET